MAKNIFTTFLFLNILFFIMSCDSDTISDSTSTRCDDGILNGNETEIDCGGSCTPCLSSNVLMGEVVGRLVLYPDINYVLSGPLLIRDGASLEMTSGTKITALKGTNAYIAIAQGGKLYVWGNENDPVIITSGEQNPSAGDWGGIIICGKAPINTGLIDRSEIGDLLYGGSEIEDSSGSINYLRLEYTGETYNESIPFNGISFFGVGAFTVINHIQTHMSKGNGFKFYGGTANSKWLVSTNSNNNSISLSDGWNGNGESWFFKNNLNAGIKIENNSINTSAVPITTGNIQNISIIGPATKGALHYTNGGGNININDLYTKNMTLGVNIDDPQASLMVDNEYLKINTILFESPNTGFEPTNYTGTNPNFYIEGVTSGAGNGDLSPLWTVGWTIGL